MSTVTAPSPARRSFEPAGAGRRRRRRQFEVLPPSRSSTAATPATDGDGLLPPPPRLLQHCQRLVPPVPTAPLPGPRAIGVVDNAADGETFASSRLPFRDCGRQTSSTATTPAAGGGDVTILPPRGPSATMPLSSSALAGLLGSRRDAGAAASAAASVSAAPSPSSLGTGPSASALGSGTLLFGATAAPTGLPGQFSVRG